MPKSKKAKSKRSTYRPPDPPKAKPSPKWVPAVGIALVVVGALVVIATYLTGLPTWLIVVGFAGMAGGLIALSQWR